MRNILIDQDAFSAILSRSSSILADLVSIKQTADHVDAQVSDHRAVTSAIQTDVRKMGSMLTTTALRVIVDQEHVHNLSAEITTVNKTVFTIRDHVDKLPTVDDLRRFEARLHFTAVSVVFLC